MEKKQQSKTTENPFLNVRLIYLKATNLITTNVTLSDDSEHCVQKQGAAVALVQIPTTFYGFVALRWLSVFMPTPGVASVFLKRGSFICAVCALSMTW